MFFVVVDHDSTQLEAKCSLNWNTPLRTFHTPHNLHLISSLPYELLVSVLFAVCLLYVCVCADVAADACNMPVIHQMCTRIGSQRTYVIAVAVVVCSGMPVVMLFCCMTDG